MDEEIQSAGKRNSPYVYYGSFYLITVGVLYLWGYWGRFDINILEYISFTDVVKLSLYPIVSVFLVVVIGTIIGAFSSRNGDEFPLGLGPETRAGRFLLRHKNGIVYIYVIATVSVWLFGSEVKWHLIPPLIGIPVYVLSLRYRFLSEIIPNSKIRSILVYLLAILPIYSYSQGNIDALRIINGYRYKYIVSGKIPGLEIPYSEEENNRIKYVGYMNTYLFLLMPDNKTLLIVQFEEIKGLQIRSKRVLFWPALKSALSECSWLKLRPSC